MKRNEVEFDAEELIQSVEAFARHASGGEKMTLKSREIRLPAPIKPMKPEEIVAIREKLSASQAVFARLLNVPTVTAISWERGRRTPTGAALRLLDLARRKPEILQEL